MSLIARFFLSFVGPRLSQQPFQRLPCRIGVKHGGLKNPTFYLGLLVVTWRQFNEKVFIEMFSGFGRLHNYQ